MSVKIYLDEFLLLQQKSTSKKLALLCAGTTVKHKYPGDEGANPDDQPNRCSINHY
jgi:hypothetical protein